MCGIAGIVTWGGKPASRDELVRMTTAIAHRGPDDAGVWIDEDAGIAFGHRRLSIIDLSIHGHQPMHSASGRYVLCYNGEIYNFEDIRRQLEAEHAAPAWRGHSDSEVLLAAIERWGIESALARCVGMFALAVWDRETRTLSFARDRIGEKPLYFGIIDGRLLFASELSALKQALAGEPAIDRASLARFVQFSYIPAPQTIYQGIYKLRPGHLLSLRSILDTDTVGKPYWRLSADDPARQAELLTLPDSELVSQVHDTLAKAVKAQMISDVPFGAFLSGGIDSSLVVSLMQSQSQNKVRTFTIGFEEREFDEAPYAKEVARHLGTEHTELYVTSKDALDLIPNLAGIYSEPFADSSQIPTTLVSRLTRDHVTVALSGDGGDELFAGYPRYQLTERLWKRIRSIPLPLRSAASRALRCADQSQWDAVLSRLLSEKRLADINGRRVHRLAQLFTARDLGSLYVRLMSQWSPDQELVLGSPALDLLPNQGFDRNAADALSAMRRWDVDQYLPDDLLVKVDRASMSTSLETRAPMLDHRLVELAFSLPRHALVRNGVGKWALREVLDAYVPRKLIERPKAGFSIPIGPWLAGPLRSWAEDLLDPARLSGEGFFDAGKIAGMWNEHKSGKFDRSSYLWNVLIFNSWFGAQRSSRAH